MAEKQGKNEKPSPVPAPLASPSPSKTLYRYSDTARRNVLTPSPDASGASMPVEDTISGPRSSAMPQDDLDYLFRFLDLSESDAAALTDFLALVRISQIDDLAWLGEEDLHKGDLSDTLKRKMSQLAFFLATGGDLAQIKSVKDLLVRSYNDAVKTRFSSDLQAEHSKESPKKKEESVIELNVGGYRFTTSRETLCRVEGSVLEAIVSGRHKNAALIDKDGSYFIDRDGKHFEHILNFLRVGAVVTLPPDAAGKEALLVEADYYGLKELVHAIQVPETDPSAFLSREVLETRDDEDRLRQQFVENPFAARADPFRGLLPMFCQDNGVHPMPIRYQERTFTPDSVYLSSLRPEAVDGVPVSVASLDEFQTNFNRVHDNVLHRISDVLQQEPIVVAGGSVLQALTTSPGLRTADWWGPKSDVDLFLYCSDKEEANRVARRIFYALAVDHERWVIMRSRGVITMHQALRDEPVIQKVQVVLRLYDSPAEILLGFDCDCCCCAYDGREVWVTSRWLHAIRSGINVLNPLHAWPKKASYEIRLAKYAYRGFAVAVPGLDKKRIDHETILRSDLGELKGLARFLKVSYELEARMTEKEPPESLLPMDVKALKPHVKNSLTEDELLMEARLDFYDESANVIISPVYTPDGTPEAYLWYSFNHIFPLSSESRDPGWESIENASEGPEGLPLKLLDAWDDKKRSREYLNARMDKFDLDNTYYSHAYYVCEA